jgi:hypothetical protein
MRMTREEILDSFIVSGGVIHSPGHQEGNMIYVPYYYDMVMKGEDEEVEYGPDDKPYSFFKVVDEDLQEFPELEDIYGIMLWTSDQGFVMYQTLADAEAYQEQMDRIREWAEEEEAGF